MDNQQLHGNLDGPRRWKYSIDGIKWIKDRLMDLVLSVSRYLWGHTSIGIGQILNDIMDRASASVYMSVV